MGESDKADLQAELERAGWRVKRRDGDDWWEHEVWELASTWRPTHAKVEKPTDRMEADRSAIRVSPRWPERMKEIVVAANSLRP